jgi:hypothetical protein
MQNLDKEQNVIFEQLKEMQKGGSMSFWPTYFAL